VKKSTFSALFLLALGLGSALPASADESKEMLKNVGMFPVRTLALGAGLLVGTPIAISRRTADRCSEYTGNFADKIGGKDHLPPVLFASVLGVPFGVIAGTSEGVYLGGKNAIANCVEKPFSKESFSLGELE